MDSLSRPPYPVEPGLIGRTRDGTAVALGAMTAAAADVLGPGLAAIDPWARVGYSPEKFTKFFATVGDGAMRYQIAADARLAGVIVVRNPWLAGPYLHVLGLLPGFNGRGIGDVALTWFETEARRAQYRNIWLCVSSFNTGAQRFYQAHGFQQAAVLDQLAFNASDEILMRKRVS